MAEQPYDARRMPRPGRLYEIDLLRFLAAAMVMLFHYSFSQARGLSSVDYSDVLGPVAHYGYLGVHLFFMVSGLVVFMSLWGRRPSRFLISRVSRLYPAFWVAVTITALTVLVVKPPGRAGVSIHEYLLNLTMFSVLFRVPYVEAVYWTLWSEWRFYALLFLLSLLGLSARRTVLFLWGWLAATLLVEVVPLPGLPARALNILIQPEYSHFFIAGMALYLIHRSERTSSLLPLLIISYLNAVYQGVRHALQFSLDPLVVATVITVIFLAMMAVATGRLSRWGSPRLAPLGRLTYPLYLLHQTLGQALFHLVGNAVNRWVLLAGVIAVVLSLSWVICDVVEAALQPRLRAWLTGAWDRLVDRLHRPVPVPVPSLAEHHPRPETPWSATLARMSSKQSSPVRNDIRRR